MADPKGSPRASSKILIRVHLPEEVVSKGSQYLTVVGLPTDTISVLKGKVFESAAKRNILLTEKPGDYVIRRGSTVGAEQYRFRGLTFDDDLVLEKSTQDLDNVGPSTTTIVQMQLVQRKKLRKWASRGSMSDMHRQSIGSANTFKHIIDKDHDRREEEEEESMSTAVLEDVDDVLLQGYLRIKSKQSLLKGYKRKFVFLTNEALHICKDAAQAEKELAQAAADRLGSVMIRLAKVTAVTPLRHKPERFNVEYVDSVTNQTRLEAFRADTEVEAHAWMVAISNSSLHAAQVEQTDNRDRTLSTFHFIKHSTHPSTADETCEQAKEVAFKLKLEDIKDGDGDAARKHHPDSSSDEDDDNISDFSSEGPNLGAPMLVKSLTVMGTNINQKHMSERFNEEKRRMKNSDRPVYARRTDKEDSRPSSPSLSGKRARFASSRKNTKKSAAGTGVPKFSYQVHRMSQLMNAVKSMHRVISGSVTSDHDHEEDDVIESVPSRLRQLSLSKHKRPPPLPNWALKVQRDRKVAIVQSFVPRRWSLDVGTVARTKEDVSEIKSIYTRILQQFHTSVRASIGSDSDDAILTASPEMRSMALDIGRDDFAILSFLLKHLINTHPKGSSISPDCTCMSCCHPPPECALFAAEEKDPEPTMAEQELVVFGLKLAEWALKNYQECILAVLVVFDADHPMLHDIALRVLYVLLQRTQRHARDNKSRWRQTVASASHHAEVTNQKIYCPACFTTSMQLAHYVMDNCRADRFTASTRNALFTILVTPLQSKNFLKTSKQGVSISPQSHVCHPAIWVALLTASAHNNWEMKKEVLANINLLLIQSAPNRISIIDQQGWQEWLAPLSMDIPLPPFGISTAKEIYQFSMNVFVLLHTETFSNSTHFGSSLLATLRTFQTLFSNSPRSLERSHSLLYALSTKFMNVRRKLFDLIPSLAWTNLFELIRIIRTYCFSSPTLGRSLFSDPLAVPFQFPQHLTGLVEKKSDKPRSHRRQQKAYVATPVKQASLNVHPSIHQSSETTATEVIIEAHQNEFIAPPTRFRPLSTTVRFGDQLLSGVHWTDDGKALDSDIVTNMLTLIRALMKEVAVNQDNSKQAKAEKALRDRLQAEADFFAAAQSLLQIMESRYRDLTDIEISDFVQQFLMSPNPQAGLSTVFMRLNRPDIRKKHIATIPLQKPVATVAEGIEPQGTSAVPLHSHQWKFDASSKSMKNLLDLQSIPQDGDDEEYDDEVTDNDDDE